MCVQISSIFIKMYSKKDILMDQICILLLCQLALSVHGKIFERCDIKKELEDHNVKASLSDQWTCVAEEISGGNSSKIKNVMISTEIDPCRHYTLGLFQIPNEWCSSEDDMQFQKCKRNGCNLDCHDLLDDNITDDIKCLLEIHEFNNNSKTWTQAVVNKCKQIILDRDWHDLCKPDWKPTSIPLWATILIVAISSFVVFIIMYVYYRYRRNRVSVLSKSEIKQFKYGRRPSSMPLINRYSTYLQENLTDEPYNTQYEVHVDQFSIDFSVCLGSGAYGVVYKGTCKGDVVAVKTLKPNQTKEYLQSLLGEIKILSFIGRHECVVNLVGAHTKNLHKGILYIFTEYCGLGSLEKFLRSNRKHYVREITDDDELKFDDTDISKCSIDDCITLKHLFQYSHQIAKAMEFLSSKQCIHGDLAARNVLLTDRNNAKISDFGLSRKLYGYINYIKKKEEPLPWRWMAIESLREMNFSTSSDVWMYGVLLFEIFSLGEVPYPGLSWSLDFVDNLEKGFRMLRPKHAPVDVYKDVMLNCWEMNPTSRPSFSDLSQFFYEGLHTMTSKDYIEVVEPN